MRLKLTSLSALVTVAVFVLSGCGITVSTLPGAPTSATPSLINSSPGPTAITADDMLGAPVPSLCGHPAGQLTKGSLGTPGAGKGGAAIARLSSGDWQQLSFRSWSGADGAPYAALVVSCDQGGVSWPPHVVFYGAGPAVLGEIDVAKTVGNGRQSVHALDAIGDGVRLSLSNTYAKGEDGCCGTVDVIADFTWNGTSVTGNQVKRISERATAKEAFFAAMKGDKAAIEKLFNADGRAEALDFHDSVFINDPAQWRTDFSCDSADADELFDGTGRSYERVCYFGAKDAYVAGFIAMKHTGFGAWKAAGVQFTSTD